MSPLVQAILDARCGPAEPMEEGSFTQAFCFAPDFIGFAGHFPNDPLLPAFVQTRIAQTLIEVALSRTLVLRTVSQAKFRRPIRPGETVTFRIHLPTQALPPRHARVHVLIDAETAASFRLFAD
ncbi:MAG: hypothetical protein JJV98_20900 [Desulfosarcina sp.]|nr:hypothetical protein [Desulfobacterales bacterium]